MPQARSIRLPVIIGLIDGLRSPLILAATMTFLHIQQNRFQWVFAAFLLASTVILGLGHWFTLKSENQSATGEALEKEKQLFKNLDIQIDDATTIHRKAEYVEDKLTPSIRVGTFFLLGGSWVLLPFCIFTPMEKALLFALITSIPALILCAIIKARYYKAAVMMEIIRTALLPVIAIGLLYCILQVMK